MRFIIFISAVYICNAVIGTKWGINASGADIASFTVVIIWAMIGDAIDLIYTIRKMMEFTPDKEEESNDQK